MMRHAFTTPAVRAPFLLNKSMRQFTTSSRSRCKARLNQFLEQVRSAEVDVCKTVREKTLDDKALRRNQLIWLVKHSLGQKRGNKKVSPHGLPWSEGSVDTEGKREGGVGVTVWPYLW